MHRLQFDTFLNLPYEEENNYSPKDDILNDVNDKVTQKLTSINTSIFSLMLYKANFKT